ncbi:hypothetical protein [Microlunatus sp. GCM10028923]|uniref:hypothetical protein n=1 Tax=Microlunatus sp. GCM10028923 TaxID=3273400 RepID=UPI00360DE14A
MIDPHFVFLAAAIGLTGTIRYAIGTLRGRTSPNRVTWILWAAAPLIGFFAQLDSQVGLPAVSTLAIGVGPLLVVIASFVNKRATVRLTAFDFACGAVAVVSLIIWLGLDAAPVAVVFAVLAEAVGAVPTVRKAWRDPWSENAVFYVLVGVNGTLTLLTLINWTPATWGFPGYLVLLSLTMTAVITLRRKVVRS